MTDAPAASARRGLLITDRAHTPAGTLAIALVAGSALGLAAWWLYAVVPAPWNTLANTSALWGLVAAAAAYAQRAERTLAVLAGMLAQLGMVVAFAMADGASQREWLMYLLVGVIAGGAFGAAGWLARSDARWDRLTAAGIIGGVIAGEGLYGIAVVDPAGPQWWCELALGLLLAAAIGHGVRERLFAVAAAVMVALTLLSAFSAYDAVLAA